MELIILLDENPLLEKLLDVISSLVEDHSLSLVCTFDALLNARQRRGRVDCAQSHSVRAEFLSSEDAVAVTHGGC